MNEINEKKLPICTQCASSQLIRRGKRTYHGTLSQRYFCKSCANRFYQAIEDIDNVHAVINTSSVVGKKSGWSRSVIANDEAKSGNIPEIGLKEDLQGLEVTGVTYLKKDENNILHWVKTKTKHSSLNNLADFANKLIDRVPAAAILKCPERTNGELLTQYVLTDCHIGMFAWGVECGEDWDLKIAYRSITEAINIAIANAPESKVGLLVQLGDFSHYSGHEAVTPTSGNLLDADGRFSKMIDVCEDILIETIDKLLLKHELVKIVIAEGNHDLSVSDTFRSLIKRYYRKNTRIEVIGGPNPFYCLQHGKTMLGYHHGHKRKRIALPSHFAQYFSKIWGDTEYRFIHCGHLHTYLSEEKGGAVTTQHQTLAAADAYGSHKFDKSLRSINTITYSDRYGMLSQNFIPIEMVNNQLLQ